MIVVDEDGNRLLPFESGTVYMKMGGGQFEYKGDDEKTQAARLDDFFTVGDVGYLDDDGFLFLNDRANDMIIVGGLNIYPAEIEGASFSTRPSAMSPSSASRTPTSVRRSRRSSNYVKAGSRPTRPPRRS